MLKWFNFGHEWALPSSEFGNRKLIYCRFRNPQPPGHPGLPLRYGGAALVGVAKHFGVPITLLKQVSDSADEEASGSWFDAVDAGARQLAEAVKEFK